MSVSFCFHVRNIVRNSSTFIAEPQHVQHFSISVVFTHKHIKPAGGNMSLYGGINNKERYISGMFGTSLDFNKTEQSMSNPSHHSKKIFMF